MYRPWASRAPDAVDAMVALTKQVTANVQINGKSLATHDGPFLSSSSDSYVLQIGWGGFVPGYTYPSRSMNEDLGTGDLMADGVQQGLGPGILETFSIGCASLARSGSTSEKTMSQLRKAAYANTAYIGQVCAVTPPLNGTVARITMGSVHALRSVQERRGLLVMVTFSVKCDAWSQQ